VQTLFIENYSIPIKNANRSAGLSLTGLNENQGELVNETAV